MENRYIQLIKKSWCICDDNIWIIILVIIISEINCVRDIFNQVIFQNLSIDTFIRKNLNADLINLNS
ncbi:hypothetical protein CYV26_06530 [Carnobacterium maltaromaticum]|nr:hypothetical protein CYV30_09530 [Carnobacterium maltaromaticum]PLS35472.1 hypothetical protein CYV31_09505 [Carnobacterium maltaromaticum]PLS35923.1 hypothetical protein CYV33_06525 [Carnobacterium maltaromaticum]PLS42381.1 hypothetical protein CYV28_09470 [Carnobacterium maltaromaticum]PLS45401.1 hypothetical protein CYV27_06515 [Carnobacterium maltaromaticum]